MLEGRHDVFFLGTGQKADRFGKIYPDARVATHGDAANNTLQCAVRVRSPNVREGIFFSRAPDLIKNRTIPRALPYGRASDTYPMKGNIPIPELPFGEEVWLMVAVTSVRERRTKDGRPFREVNARNATGVLPLKIWAEVLEGREELRPGLWGVTGKLESFQDRSQFVVSEYRPITIEQYREYLGCDPLLPRAFTLDIETLALPGFRDRVGPKLDKDLKLGYMRLEQQQRCGRARRRARGGGEGHGRSSPAPD